MNQYSGASLYTTGQKQEWLGFSFANQYDEDQAQYIYGENPVLLGVFSPGRKSMKSSFSWTKYGKKILDEEERAL